MPSVVLSVVFGWNELDRSALGVFGAAQRLAKDMSIQHAVLVVGQPSEEFLADIAKFVDRVHVIEHPLLGTYHCESTLDAIATICKDLRPKAILFGNDTCGQELAPRLAYRLGGSAAGDALTLNGQGKSVVLTRSVHGGKALATLALHRAPAVVWIRARIHEPAQQLNGTAEVRRWPIEIESNVQIKVIDHQSEAKKTARLEDARVVVSGGRGLGGPEPFVQLQALADVIGAQMAASRAACDAGWVPVAWQVGQTGKKVSPQLYLAVAISGASQHMMGITDAKAVVAINVDPDAPIFQHCRFGLADDFRQVVGPLRDKLSELQA